MPYTLEVDIGRQRVLFEATGSFPQVEALSAIHAMVGHPEFRPGFDALVDLTAVEDIPLSGADIRQKVRVDTDLMPKLGSARWAFVATRDVVYGLARMYQVLMEGTSIEVQTFRDLEMAEAWLDDRPTE